MDIKKNYTFLMPFRNLKLKKINKARTKSTEKGKRGNFREIGRKRTKRKR